MKDLRDDPILKAVPEVDGFKVLPPCVLCSLIGKGGFGAVYRGVHVNLEAEVAVKCLFPELARDDGDLVERFQREAKLMAKIDDPNLIRVHDACEWNGLHYIIMRFVSGESASQYVKRRGPLPLDEALAILRRAASGLSTLHQAGIVHRDIKPGNILISTAGEVKLADLGLAKATRGPESTQSKVIMGTYAYMPPEQWESLASVSFPGDVHALGAVLYFLLTGEHAFGTGGDTEVMRRICLEPFPQVLQKAPNVPAEIQGVLERCTRKRPEERYPHAAALLADLSRLGIADNADALLSGAGRRTATETHATLPSAETVARARLAMQDKTWGRTPELETRTAGPVGPPRPPAPRRRSWKLSTAALVLLAGVGGLGYWFGPGLWRRIQGPSTEPGDAARREEAKPATEEPPGKPPEAPPAAPPKQTGELPAKDAESSAPAVEPAKLVNEKPEPPAPPVPAPAKPMLELSWAKPVPGTVAEETKGYPSEVEDNVTGIKLVFIPDGWYLRGSPASDSRAKDEERPQHRVHITQPFYLGKYEVTNEQFRLFAPNHKTGEPQSPELDELDRPALTVPYDQAAAFAAKYNFRLPTEAEWEYACRAGSKDRYPWGPELTDSVEFKERANFKWRSRSRKGSYWDTTAPVGSYTANKWRLHDMIGNAAEWCAGYYDADEYKGYGRSVDDPRGAASTPDRVARGGYYLSPPLACTAARRFVLKADSAVFPSWVGFRVARQP